MNQKKKADLLGTVISTQASQAIFARLSKPFVSAFSVIFFLCFKCNTKRELNQLQFDLYVRKYKSVLPDNFNIADYYLAAEKCDWCDEETGVALKRKSDLLGPT